MSLEREAMKLLGELKSDVLKDYHKLVGELNRKYDSHKRAQAYKIKFRSCIHRRNGNIMTYAQELTFSLHSLSMWAVSPMNHLY